MWGLWVAGGGGMLGHGDVVKVVKNGVIKAEGWLGCGHVLWLNHGWRELFSAEIISGREGAGGGWRMWVM
eukprot:6248379-Heterocapsa_arctica.AAC.1